ncbi:CPBP family intramembrane glutamic endopeptidase [Gaetbulibacter aquiaggeris]|uniref:CPBP family intramembrane glutamic endopeptidase n=1 Tax=Gaetbulibacter aquiaggeris TaxID=1735373 RepID=A0ABW7MTT0_9FLAO
MKSSIFKLSEFFFIFILIPVSFAVPYSPWIKLGVGSTGFIYIIYVLLKVEKEPFKATPHLDWKLFWKQTLVKLLIIISLTTLFVWITNKEAFFNVLLNKPILWGVVLLIYSIFSVYPQELVYRTFFFKRYELLFTNTNQLIFVNAIVFSLGHIFFKNTLVIILTFLGGLLFAFTFKKTKSTVLVSIEHAIYGCWLFTVGMGAMLGFPA